MNKFKKLRIKQAFMRKSKKSRTFSKVTALTLSASMIVGSLTYTTSLDAEAAELDLSGSDVLQAEELDAVMAAEELDLEEDTPDILFVNRTGGSYTDFTTDEVIADLTFGLTKEQLTALQAAQSEEEAEKVLEAITGTITSANYYKTGRGYGFRDVEYNNEAKGWVNNVYYPREISRQEAGSSYVQNAEGYLGISSKVWKEVNSKEYRDYTYENTSTFDMAADNADYKIEVTLVNPTDAEYTAVLEAEDITRTPIGADSSAVKVAANGEQKVTIKASVIDGELNLKFLAPSSAETYADADYKVVYVSHVTVTRLATGEEGSKPTIFLAGDSTVQSYVKYDSQVGWGQRIYQYFLKEGEEAKQVDVQYCKVGEENLSVRQESMLYETESLYVQNRALGGRSSKSFVEEGLLDDLLEDVKPGDYLFVQFGHNDATAARPNRYVSSADFKKWILCYIEGALQRGVTPVLVTPCARNSFTANSNGTATFKSDFEAYR